MVKNCKIWKLLHAAFLNIIIFRLDIINTEAKIKMLIRSKKITAMEYLEQVSKVVPEFGEEKKRKNNTLNLFEIK